MNERRTMTASLGLLTRIKLVLANLLGNHYATAIRTAERTLGAFASAFLAKIVASGLDVHHVTQLSYWQTAGVAGLAAAVALVQSVLTAAITGVPSAASLVSSTVRAARELGGARIKHHVPLRASHTLPPHKRPARRSL